MKNTRIIELIQDPDNVQFSDRSCIEQELKKYPFVQAYHILLLHWSLKFSSEENVNKIIEKTAIYSTHRNLVHDFINKNLPKKMNDEILMVNTTKFLPSSHNNSVENKKVIKAQESYIDQLGLSYLFSNSDTIKIEDTNFCKLNDDGFSDKQESEPIHISHLESATEEIDSHSSVLQNNNEQEDAIPIEKLTFNEWLELPENKPGNLKINSSIQVKQKGIIDKFIETSPKISSPKTDDKQNKKIDVKKDEIKDIANLMTITLAQLYVEQGKYDTAIAAFKTLSLKYPEKSSYFASEIKKLKKLKNSR